MSSLQRSRGLVQNGCLNFQRRFAADEKAVKNRMRSVSAIQKITKAMKMVAASKLRADQRRREEGLPFCTPLVDLLRRLEGTGSSSSDSRAMYIAVTGDKGLCGSANSAVAKLARSRLAGTDHKLIGIGDKIRAALQTHFSGNFAAIYSETNKVPLNFGLACYVAEKILSSDAPDQVPSSVHLLFNKFNSVISSDAVDEKYVTVTDAVERQKAAALATFELEPSSGARDLFELALAASIYRALLEGATSEQSQRMTAMDSASRNAGDMLNALTLSYNKARQMKITMELVENISGANAQEDS